MDSRDIEKWRVKLDSYANVEDGVEYWLARDLMEPMGYTRWENFAEVVKRAKVSCETNKTPVDSHFRDTTKMVTAGVAARAVKDYKLTRYPIQRNSSRVLRSNAAWTPKDSRSSSRRAMKRYSAAEARRK